MSGFPFPNAVRQRQPERNAVGHPLVASATTLRAAVARIRFAAPVTHVYNPLSYAWEAHEVYLRRYGQGRRRVVFVGMNPGPFGMVQTGVPFGDIAAVTNWLGIRARIGRPEVEHPRRPVTGFDCPRGEVSGQRLWGLFAVRFGTPERFFKDHFVLNYCPLAFLEASGRNRTPDKLPRTEQEVLHSACDAHLRSGVGALEPEWVVGIGDFAAGRIARVFSGATFKVGKILHPSPASPLANRDWAGTVTRQLQALGVW